MNLADLATDPAYGLALAVGVLATLAFAGLAPRLGWTDDGSDAPERKLQRATVPPVGGPVLACAALALSIRPGGEGLAAILPRTGGLPFTLEPAVLSVALALAFATGLVDDLRARGLSPVAKLGGQLAAALAFGAALERGGEPAAIGARAIAVALAVGAQNVANTFDNADGALTSLALVALAPVTALGAALIGFLPFNLFVRRAQGRVPLAYLGDSGSHLLGLLLLATPLGWAALTLPALDLARVCWLRARAGHPLWRGDRRHLAHRLQACGRSPTAVVAILLACSAPALLAPLAVGPLAGPCASLAVGALGSAAALSIALLLHPERAPG